MVTWAVVFQAIGMASFLEAERAAVSIFSTVSSDFAAALDVVVVADGESLVRQETGAVSRVVDVGRIVPREVAVGLEAVAAASGDRGCRRSDSCSVAAVRVLRRARIAQLVFMLGEYESFLAMDSDSLACESLEGLLRWGSTFDATAAGTWDIAVRPVPVQVNKGPAKRVPLSVPEPNGGMLLLRNTSTMHAVLREWRKMYDEYVSDTHPTSDQPLLRAAISRTRAIYRTMDRTYGCPPWVDKARACPAFTEDLQRDARAKLTRKKRDKLTGPNAAKWRAHVNAIARSKRPCAVLHGLHASAGGG